MKSLTFKEAANKLDRTFSAVARAARKTEVLTLLPMSTPGANFVSEEQVNLFIGKELSLHALSSEERQEWARLKAIIESIRPEPEPPNPTRKPKPERRDVDDRPSKGLGDKNREPVPTGSLAPTPLASRRKSEVEETFSKFLQHVEETARALAPTVNEFTPNPAYRGILGTSKEEKEALKLFATMVRKYIPEGQELSTQEVMERLYQISQEDGTVSFILNPLLEAIAGLQEMMSIAFTERMHQAWKNG